MADPGCANRGLPGRCDRRTEFAANSIIAEAAGAAVRMSNHTLKHDDQQKPGMDPRLVSDNDEARHTRGRRPGRNRPGLGPRRHTGRLVDNSIRSEITDGLAHSG